MDKLTLKLLEQAFEAEVAAAMKERPSHLLQTNSKLAQQLVANGLLRENIMRIGGRMPATVKGYELTDAGRHAYCAACDES